LEAALWKLQQMDTSGHLPVSESATPRGGRAKAQRRSRTKTRASTRPAAKERPLAAAGTLSRTKSLLLAALRVWELKQRIRE
jgi:hypothetical protein